MGAPVIDTSTEPDRPGPDASASWLERLMRPAPIALFGVMFSLTAWSIGNLLRDEAIDFSANLTWGTFVYLAWLAAAIAVAHAGFKVAAPRTAPRRPTPWPMERALHATLLLAASIGVAYMVWLWHRAGLDVIAVIEDNQANLLRQAIPFSPGPATLRYAAIPAAAIAMRNIFVHRLQPTPNRLRSVDALSLVALAIVAIPSSRLSVLMALVTAAALVCYVDDRIPSLRKIVVVAVLLTVVLAALNYSRNGGYYRERGVSDPASQLLYQSVSYLGAAFEGGTVAGDVLLGRTTADAELGVGNVVTPFVPTFVPGFEPNAGGGIDIHEISSIDGTLTTNSMFAEILLRDGLIPVLGVLLLVFGVSFVCSMLLRRRTMVTILAAGPLLYGFAETWRLNLFNDGVLVFCVGAPLLTYLALDWTAKRWPHPLLIGSGDRAPPERTAAGTRGEPTVAPDR